MKRLSTFIGSVSVKLHDSFGLRLAYYAMIVALLVLTYLIGEGHEVGFVYNEF